MSTTALHLWITLSRAFGAVAAHAEADATRHGITLAEFGALEALYHKGPMLQGQLQEKILISSGGITWVVNKLIDRGLVRRRPCPDDRRARWAELTPAGSAFIREHFPDHARAIERATSGLTGAERTQATKLLRKLGTSAAELPVPTKKEA
jgi:MarR family transcriptional regulator, 2-MHQ and catechol-resistance regulon repressor